MAKFRRKQPTIDVWKLEQDTKIDGIMFQRGDFKIKYRDGRISAIRRTVLPLMYEPCDDEARKIIKEIK